MKPQEEQTEEALIAMGQSRDAVTVFDGNALCLDHLLERFRSIKPVVNC